MSEKLRFGVIGTSFINAFHIRSINSHPQAEVIAVCGRNAENAQKVANENGIPHVYSDYGDLIAQNNLDGIVVGTPDYLHHEMVLRGAEAGLHIVCEKPVAQTLDQALEMLGAVESSNLNHMTFFSFRWVPHYARLKEMLDDGYVGRILLAELRFLQPSIPDPEGTYDWHYDSKHGTGALGNISSHAIHLAHWFIGDIETVVSLSTTHFDRLGEEKDETPQLDDTVFMTVRFNNGAIGSIHASSSATTSWQEQMVSIRGTEGNLEAGFNREGAALYGAKAGEPSKLIAGPDDLWDDVELSEGNIWDGLIKTSQKSSIGCRQFIDDIMANRRSVPSLQDGVKVQAVMEAAAKSSISGRAEAVARV